MGDKEKKKDDEPIEENEYQMNEREVEEEAKGEANNDQVKQELDRLEDEKEKLAEIWQKENERAGQLAQDKKKIDEIALEAKLTTEDLIKSYEQADQGHKDLIEERSKRELEVREVSQKIETIRETKGDDDPELGELEARLLELKEEDKTEDELENDINARKAKLEKLLEEHAASLEGINTKRRLIDEEIVKLASQRKARELEEKKILAKIAQLKGEAAPGEGLEPATIADDEKPVSNEISPTEGSFPLEDPAVVAQLREAGAKALIAAKAVRTLKEEIAGLLQKDRLAEDVVKIMPLKQNELLFRLAELDEITRGVQHLMGLGAIATLELGPPTKSKFLSDFGARPSIRTLSQLRPENTLPQVVVCGPDTHYPQIIVCGASKVRNIQEGILQNGRFQPRNITQRHNTTQCTNNYPGAQSDFFIPSRQGDGMLMGMGSPYFRAGTMANQSLMASFGHGNMGMPLASWTIAPGFGYTITPSLGTMMMPQPMMNSGIVQSASVGSFIPCPCICPKKNKKWKKKNVVPQQVYSCPSVVGKPLNYSGA